MENKETFQTFISFNPKIIFDIAIFYHSDEIYPHLYSLPKE